MRVSSRIRWLRVRSALQLRELAVPCKKWLPTVFDAAECSNVRTAQSAVRRLYCRGIHHGLVKHKTNKRQLDRDQVKHAGFDPEMQRVHAYVRVAMEGAQLTGQFSPVSARMSS